MSESLLTIKDVAERLNIGERTAYRLIEEGQLKARRIGSGRGTLRVKPADLERFINQPDDASLGSRPRLAEPMEIL